MGNARKRLSGTGHSLNRRRFLAGAGALGAGGIAGCTNTSNVPDTNASGAAGARPFNIPKNPKLPTSSVKLRWTDSGDRKAVFFNAFFPAYHDKHSNIDVTYSGTNWPAIQKEITLGVRNGTAPNVFQLPSTITMAQAVSNKWVAAYDDIVPDWAQVKKRFPVGAFATGVTDFDGKTYGFPISSNRQIGNLLLRNKALTDGLNYDFSKPLQWDEFRKLAKDVTKKGNGKYYGLIMGLAQDGRMSGPVDTLSWLGGVHGGADGINWKTGDFNYTNPVVAEAIELILAMKADGSIFPGSTSLIAATARGRFPQGVAGMILQGPWNIAPWIEGDPNFKLGVSMPPLRDPTDIWPIGTPPGGGNNYVYSSASTQPERTVIGDIFSYLGSEPGQEQWANRDGAGDPAMFPRALKQAKVDTLSKTAINLGFDNTVLMPEPSVRNPDVQRVYEVQKPPQPDFSGTCVGLFTGQIKGVKAALKRLQDNSNRTLDDAIKTAKRRGAKVSRDDWIFSDWNPRSAYTKLYQK